MAQFLNKLRFDVKGTDPLTYLGVTALLMQVALLASWLPARRVVKVDPVIALRAEKVIDGSVNPTSFNWKLWPGVVLLFLAVSGQIRSEESDRVYSLAEVAVIDRENKLWRAVDVTRTVEANVERLLAAGCPAAEVDALKTRLAAMWKVEPWLHFGWLAPGTAERIEELTPEFTVRLKEARVREMLNRLGGLRDPLTSTQVYAQWRTAIYKELDDRELKDVVLLNSAPALAMYAQLKDQPLTVEERRSLCLLQQEHLGSLQQATESRAYLTSGRVARDRAEALLDYWQQMRDLLGDDRFAVYLQAAEAGFAHMAGVLRQIDGVTNAKALDLWWVRKRDELADLRMVVGVARAQLKIQAGESAVAILGPDALQIYQADDDARWLKRSNPGLIPRKRPIAQIDGKAEIRLIRHRVSGSAQHPGWKCENRREERSRPASDSRIFCCAVFKSAGAKTAMRPKSANTKLLCGDFGQGRPVPRGTGLSA